MIELLGSIPPVLTILGLLAVAITAEAALWIAKAISARRYQRNNSHNT